MKTLLIKELREHFKVALIGLAVLTVMLVLAFQGSSAQILRAASSYGYDASEGLQPLLSKPILIQAAFFCGIFGTLLGWLQIRAENHPDLWAFLVHRPIPRTTILRSKVAGGLLLYAAGAGLPMLVLVLVVSIPGHVAAPFAWAMALPLAAIFLAGMVCYFAGLLTGLRKARWFASRGIGLGLAVIAYTGLFAAAEFWQALLIIIAAGVILALAVWGSFQTGGYYRDQPVLGRMALTAASVASVAVLIGVVCSFTIGMWIGSGEYTYSQYQLLKDGSIIKITQRVTSDLLDDAEIVDLSGKPLVDEKTGRKLKPKELQQRYPAGLSASVDFKRQSRTRHQSRESYSDAARFFSPWRVFDKAIWYLTADGRLVAYHGITRRLVGSLEPPKSMADGSLDDGRFSQPTDYTWSYLQEYTMPEILTTARIVYLVDLEKRELKPFFTTTNGDAIGGCSTGASPFSPKDHNITFILTRTSIQLLNSYGKPLLHVPYEPSYPSYPSVSVHWLDPTNTFAVRFEPDYLLNKASGGKLLSRVEWVEADGRVRKTLDLPNLLEPGRGNLAERLALPLVPFGIPVYSWDGPYRFWQMLRIGMTILCVWMGWWLGLRNNIALKAKVGWGIFHLVFGLPGLLAFLAVQEWPARESCAQCKKLRVVDRERCEHCGASFPPPEKTGTEIFEPSQQVKTVQA